MRVLFINSEYPPVGAGAGNASANLARVLAGMGCEVVVITSGYRGLPNEDFRDGVRILRGPAIRGQVDRSGALEQTIFIGGAAYRCLKLMREFKPDVVLAFFGLPSGAVALLLRVVFGIPYVISLRGGDVPGFRPYDFWFYHKLAAPALRLVWHGASAVVANSRGLRDLARAFDPAFEISIVPNGVDLARFGRMAGTGTAPRILSVGRIVHQKGLDVALVALAGLTELAWEWRVAGDGPQLAALRTLSQAYGLDGRIRFLGWQKSEQLAREYAEANIFLFPSRDEGMPNAVLEAMASGLPVIATKIAGNEELVVEGETGALVPLEDAEALRAALRSLLEDGSQRERWGRAGRERVQRMYAWENAAQEYRTILEKAIEACAESAA
jgi:glycosyltransferase involved in cell wall biosynthesis